MDGLQAHEVQALFAGSDWDQDGLLQGSEAVSFFQRTGLPERQLRRVRPPALALGNDAQSPAVLPADWGAGCAAGAPVRTTGLQMRCCWARVSRWKSHLQLCAREC